MRTNKVILASNSIIGNKVERERAGERGRERERAGESVREENYLLKYTHNETKSPKPIAHQHTNIIFLLLTCTIKLFRTIINSLPKKARTRKYQSGKYHCTVDLLFDWFGISCMTTDDFCFHLQNRLIKTCQTGGQWYSDTSPFSIPCQNICYYNHSLMFTQGVRDQLCPKCETWVKVTYSYNFSFCAKDQGTITHQMALPIPTISCHVSQ